MPACPSCQAEVDLEADLCLSCGEPLGDSPAARLARKDAASKPTPTPAPAAEPAAKVRSASPSSKATLVASPAARRRSVEEPEPVRCPGCGVPSRALRCPGCGAVLRKEE